MPQYDYRLLGTASLASNGDTFTSMSTGAMPAMGADFLVPTGKQALISSITICNHSTQTSYQTGSAVYMVGVVQAGSPVSWITAGSPIFARETVTLSWGITLSAGDQVIVGTYARQTGSTSELRCAMFGALYIP